MIGKIILVLAVLGLASAEVNITGKYEAGVYKVNCSWNIQDAVHATKIKIMRNNEQITCKTGESVTSEGNCTCNNLEANTGTCTIVATAPENATDEVYSVTSCQAELCKPYIAMVDVYAPATKVENIKINNAGANEYACTFRGVPAPKIIWNVVKDNVINEVGLTLPTVTVWKSNSDLWEVKSTFRPMREKAIVMCYAVQTLKNGHNMTSAYETMAVSSAGRFSTPEVYVVFSLVYAFISKSIV